MGKYIEVDAETLGSRIAKIRVEQGISRRLLALDIGVSPETIRKIEVGITGSPRASLLEEISRRLNVSANYLLYGDTKNAPPVIVRQVKEHLFEIELPQYLSIDVQTREELAKRIKFEFEILSERGKNAKRRGG